MSPHRVQHEQLVALSHALADACVVPGDEGWDVCRRRAATARPIGPPPTATVSEEGMSKEIGTH